MKSSRPLLVGITGGIGAGKSIVSRVFEVLGIPKYDADTRAKALMNTNQQLITQITELFGQEAYQEGMLNRQHIAAQAFENKDLLRQLNELVHPVVGKDFKRWAEQQESPYILKEAALLFESGSYQSLDKIITVTAPEQIRMERVMSRDGRSEEQVQSIINNQMDEAEKVKKSDYVITNDGQQLVIPQVLQIHSELS
ncbi:dephospho-CoA kinase [Marinoscillum sp.]|uniref:dephospho-CoA kinase n=1 Tax=Marinoscillum sp. TaxID=2024838 RepID=UPI003BAA79E3